MKKLILITVIILGVTACKNRNISDSQTEIPDNTFNQKAPAMKNVISIIEIPTSDLQRAIAFYQTILGIHIEKAEMGDVKMGLFPSETGTVNVVLANGSDYKPTIDGSILYLNGGNNLQAILNKIEPSGGKVIVPKTEISPEMGFFALFIDSEGNKLGLHSSN